MRPASQHLAEDLPSVPIVVVPDGPRAQPGPRVVAGLIALAGEHLAADCCTGIWPVHKTLAHLDLSLAGAIAAAAGVIANGLQIGFGLLGDRGHSGRGAIDASPRSRPSESARWPRRRWPWVS